MKKTGSPLIKAVPVQKLTVVGIYMGRGRLVEKSS